MNGKPIEELLKETLYCPKCGGTLWKRGRLYKKVGFIQKFECKKCRKVTTRPSKEPLVKVE